MNNFVFISPTFPDTYYQFPKEWIRSLSLSSASIAFQASNLFTISDLEGMDPESLRGYPIQKSYGVTLNLSF